MNMDINETETLEKSDEAEQLTAADSKLHADTVNVLILSAVIVFFGSVFIALTNYQDFSEKKPLTVKSFLSGQYLSEVEKRFNSSLPLQDHIHNANIFISSLFGMGSDGEYIDIEGKRATDDPYSIDQENLFTPITESRSGGDTGNDPDSPAVTDDEEPVETTDDGKNKKLSGITMKVTSADDEEESDNSGAAATTNNDPPGATTTTTVPPVTVTTESTTADTETSGPEISEPDESSEPEPPIDSGPDSEPDSEPDSVPDESSSEDDV